MNPFIGLGYSGGELTWFGRQWLLSGGTLLGCRYWLSRQWEQWFGYEPDSEAWPHWLARWLHLSGY